MPTSPQRRNRIRQAHQLRQQGQTLRQIAQQLGVAHSTIAEDLALFETDRVQLTRAITHDLLLAHTLALHDRAHQLIQRDPLLPLTRFTAANSNGQPTTLDAQSGPDQIARLEAIHERAATNALREFRQSLRELERATDRFKNQPADYPQEQLAAHDPDHPEHDRTNPNKPEHDLPQHDRTNPNKPEHDLPQHDRTNPNKSEHDLPLRPDTAPPKSAATTPNHPTTQPLTLEQLQTLLLADPPQIETLRGLVQHPERFPPELPPDLLQLMQSVIADIVAAPT